MRQTIALASLVVLSSTLSCHTGPALSGVSLECGDDDHCRTIGDDWRCYGGICIQNAPPTVADMALQRITLGAGVEATAIAEDEEGDAATFTWQQVAGPEPYVLAAPYDGPTLSLTPTDLGVHVFEVVADDGYSAGPATQLTVVVQPDSDAVYVWDQGDDSACGSFDAPCATVSRALEVMRAAPTAKPILLAATTGVEPYTACLDLEADESIQGCFEAATWTRDPTLRDRCRIECDAPTGHTIAGDATVTDTTLAMTADARPATDVLGTLHILSGAPTLIDVDVETAPCGDGCTAVGLASVYASPVLQGVEVVGGVTGFDPVDNFLGMVFLGGAPTVEATTATDGSSRGGVLMNAPVDGTATGIIGALTEIVLDGVSVTGGLAPSLRGIDIYDGSPTIQGVTVDLTAFGTRELSGIAVQGCESTPVFCDCAAMQMSCPDPLPAPPATPSTSITGSTVTLFGTSTDQVGLNPCTGLAVVVSTANAPATVSNNVITVGDDFTLSGGLFGVGDPISGSELMQISGNAVTLGEGEEEELCVILNLLGGGDEDFLSGAFGVILTGALDAEFYDNTVSVGTHGAGTYGVAAFDAGSLALEDNSIEVVGNGSGILAKQATAVAVYGAPGDAAAPSTLARNVVRLGGGVASGMGAMLAESPYWQVENNFIHGGNAVHAVGMAWGTAAPVAGWPQVRHNTIFAGGDGTSTLTSSALVIIASDADGNPANSGVFEFNLLDAGHGTGRRMMFSANGVGFFESATGNVGQFDGVPDGPRPGVIFRPTSLNEEGVTGLGAPPPWTTVLEGSGELVQMLDGGATLVVGGAQTLPGAPSASWAGSVGLSSWVVAAVPAGLAAALAEGDELPEFEIYSTQSYVYGSEQRNPAAVAAARANGDLVTDLVFIERGDAARRGLWVMPGDIGGGFEPPDHVLPMPDGDPTLLSVGNRGNTVLVVEGTKLYAHPGGVEVALDSKLPAGTSSVISHVLYASLGEEVAADPEPDLIVVADDELLVWLNPAYVDDSTAPIPDPEPVNAQPCGVYMGTTVSYPAAASITAVATGKMDDSGAGTRGIAFGCSDGRVEFFVYRTSPAPAQFVRIAEPGGSGDPVVGLACDHTLVATRSQANEVAEYQLAVGLPTTLALKASHTLLADVVWRNTATWHLDGTFTDLPGTPFDYTTDPGAPLSCTLQLHQGGDAFDLHLYDDGSNVCLNGGTDVSVTDDVDGCDARTDGQPDIGADELGAIGQACNHGT